MTRMSKAIYYLTIACFGVAGVAMLMGLIMAEPTVLFGGVILFAVPMATTAIMLYRGGGK